MRIVLAIAMVLGLAGCGQAKEQAETDRQAKWDSMNASIESVLCGEGTLQERADLLDKIINSPLFDDERGPDSSGSTDMAVIAIEKNGCPAKATPPPAAKVPEIETPPMVEPVRGS